MMTYMNIDLVSVCVAALAAWILGFIYYTVLSGPWLAAMGKTKDEACENKSYVPFAVALLASFVTAYVLAGLLNHVVPGNITVKNGVISAAYVWLGFILPPMAVNNTFGMRKPAVTVIDALYWLLALALQGAVLGAFASGMIKIPM